MTTLAHHQKMADELATSLYLMRVAKRARALQQKADIDWRMLMVFLGYRRRGIR